jgi:raffinose/stachyose/melibiose transport system substrate-binding protein
MPHSLPAICTRSCLLLPLVLLLAGCSPEQPDPGDPPVRALEVGVMYEEGAPLYAVERAIGDELERDMPGAQLTYTFNNTAARPALETRMLAGDALDVDLTFDGMDPNTHDWVEGGYIMDLTDHMTQVRPDGSVWQEDFHPLFRSAMTYEGRIFAAPEQVVLHLLHYNQGMFDEWGLQPPATWDELLELCEEIKARGVAPIAVSGQVNFYVGMWFDHLIQQLAGTDAAMAQLHGTPATTLRQDPGALRAAQEMQSLQERGYLIDGWQGTDFTTSQIYFFQGRAAMILMGSWLMTEMKGSIPSDFRLGVAPFPMIDAGVEQPAVFGRVLSWSVSAHTQQPDLAVEFVRRLTSPEAATIRARDLGAISPVIGAPTPAGIHGIETTLASAADARFVYYNYGVTSARFGLTSAWYDPLVEMWLGRYSPQEALTAIDANLDAVRAQRTAGQFSGSR